MIHDSILPSAMPLPSASKYLSSPEACSLALESYLIARRLARTELTLPYAALRVRFPVFSVVPKKKIKRNGRFNILMITNYN